MKLPDKNGHFGAYGGRYVPETLMPALLELEKAYEHYRHDREFRQEFEYYLRQYVGRPNPLYYAEKLTRMLGGARIYLKREDLNHTGAHKINNTIGQGLLARRMGKKRVIAETGAGMHGVATATVAALFGMECEVFMGEEDTHRQAQNVFRMKLLGARVTPVTAGTATLKDAMNEAMRNWVSSIHDTFYVIGTVAGPHPYPMMVRDFQSVIGHEVRRQHKKVEGRLPDCLVACVGGGSNALGLFYPFIKNRKVRLIGVEASGHGIESGRHAAPLCAGSPGILHGNRTYLLQDQHGQIAHAHSISAGLDYPGVGPEHSWLKDAGRAEYVSITDGDFDDCQARVKDMFNDFDFRDGVRLAGVNSINWARVLAQVVYYFSSAVSLGAPDRRVSFTVPTGNFGDIFAGYIARKMGLPIDQLVIATNHNDILDRAIKSGAYKTNGVKPSISPSMDIQVSSNFERALFDAYGRDGAAISALMDEMKTGGFAISQGALEMLRETFASGRCSEDETRATIAKAFAATGEVLCPHSAVGVKVAEEHLAHAPMITLATAHPAKFPDAVEAAMGVRPALPPRMADLFERPERMTRVTNDLAALQALIRERIAH